MKTCKTCEYWQVRPASHLKGEPWGECYDTLILTRIHAVVKYRFSEDRNYVQTRGDFGCRFHKPRKAKKEE